MKLNPKFLTHVTKGEHYIISTSDTKFKGIVKNNETAAFIVECLKTDTTETDVVDKLLAEYKGADRPTVERDVAGIISKLRSIGALVE
ncbi:MAG: PqqD family protein [Ruminococcus sp.]|nr:PqqD family protein [Ruminococcus sp.]